MPKSSVVPTEDSVPTSFEGFMNETDRATNQPPNPPMNWQQDFIATNLLAIGYNAWVGYLNGERGVVICSTNAPTVGIAGEGFKSHFVRRSRLAPFLNAWLAAPDTVILRHHFRELHKIKSAKNPQAEARRLHGQSPPARAWTVLLGAIASDLDDLFVGIPL
jgi:hypothetical protein